MTIPAVKSMPVAGRTRSETRATTGTISSTTSAFDNAQTFRLWTPQPILISEIVWRGIRRPATYQLKLDGVNVGSPLVILKLEADITDADRVVFSGTLPLSAGLHTLSLAKTGGSSGWRYHVGYGVTEPPWFNVSHWLEAGGGENVPVSITAKFEPNRVLYLPVPSAATSATSQSVYEWDQPFHERQITLGLIVRHGTGNFLRSFEVFVDDVSVASVTDVQREVMVPFTTPVVFEAGVKTRVKLVANTSIAGMRTRSGTWEDWAQKVEPVGAETFCPTWAVPFPSIAPEAVSDPPWGSWQFEEDPGSTTAADSSGNGNSATYADGATTTPSGSGKALLLNGTTAHVLGPAVPSGGHVEGEGVTLFCRWKGTQTGDPVAGGSATAATAWMSANSSIAVKRWVWALRPDGTQGLFVGNDYSLVTSNTPVNDGQWRSIAVSWVHIGSSVVGFFYRDGTLDGAFELPITVAGGSPNLRIGLNGRAAAGAALAGELDDARLFLRCLSHGEVRALHLG